MVKLVEGCKISGPMWGEPAARDRGLGCGIVPRFDEVPGVMTVPYALTIARNDETREIIEGGGLAGFGASSFEQCTSVFVKNWTLEDRQPPQSQMNVATLALPSLDTKNESDSTEFFCRSSLQCELDILNALSASSSSSSDPRALVRASLTENFLRQLEEDGNTDASNIGTLNILRKYALDSDAVEDPMPRGTIWRF